MRHEAMLLSPLLSDGRSFLAHLVHQGVMKGPPWHALQGAGSKADDEAAGTHGGRLSMCQLLEPLQSCSGAVAVLLQGCALGGWDH
eukprot:CAMPEP_0202351268 /NCGR_PEP_ID=MMETSP1126-20121109/7985_1 /ASSEMBLY_ACC=CAM_ASM_000457 /TAXON_ID=3047 /ORGANISM="Dunaliella tertiolecta, Strain CCMP1320" /LENGTH=85 /DNA_ID=CAMNT_0048943359 /DNA_START=660 /DNA_END=917 /DNA_ORIENTATION=-